MNIQILDSWLREYVKTDAKPNDIAKAMSLTSVSIERMEKFGDDLIYDIEVTTNRPDLMSVTGLAREAAAVLPHFGHKAVYKEPTLRKPKAVQKESIQIKNDPTLVNRVLAVVMEVSVSSSPKVVTDRLETSGIRSLNNVIDVTNYVMRTIGHPTHVFDFDRLNTKTLTIRESKNGETVQTLDKKEHVLRGGDIVAVDDSNRIVDLLGVMGLENSVVTDKTKRILFFIDNNDAKRMRQTSMGLAIRTDAAQINEKDIDPELAYDAMLYGIEMFEKYANGTVLSKIIDIYPNKPKEKTISVSLDKISSVIGVEITKTNAVAILKDLGFTVDSKDELLFVNPPSVRQKEIDIEEDVIEEIARVYGYHNLPPLLPNITDQAPYRIDEFYWEEKVKTAMKYFGYTEVYTYSMVSENQFEGPLEEAVTIRNPLTEDHVYMRKTLVPSLLRVSYENRTHPDIRIFEIANTYKKKNDDLPLEKRVFAGILRKPHASFFEVKGLLEQIFGDIGIEQITFKPSESGGIGADIMISKTHIGEIEVLDDTLVNFELDFETLLTYASTKKTFTPLAKYPPVIEDLAFVFPEDVQTGDVIEAIKKVNTVITDVTLLDKYENSRTFHILYQSKSKNLTTDEVGTIREDVSKALKKSFGATFK